MSHQHSRGRLACIEVLEQRRLLSFSSVNYSVGTSPQAVVSGDFNNDGKLDVASANGDSNNVSVLLGNGAGGLGAAQHFGCGMLPRTISAADFNEDGRLDLVTANELSWNLTILYGNGNGTFQTPVSLYPWWGALAAAVGDFNSDGHKDIVVTADDGYGFGAVQCLLGDGNGGFFAADDYQITNGPQKVVTVGDVNGDGKLDAIVACGAGGTNGWVLLGNGDGTFFEPDPWYLYEFVTDWEPRGVAAGDFTSDGKLDLVVASPSVELSRGRGDGSFDWPISYYGEGNAQTSVATADFNGDGKLDVVTTADTGKLNVLLGNGNGTWRWGGAFAIGASPGGVTVGDFNGDGRPDVATANGGSNNLSVLLNDGDWSTLPPALRISDVSVVEGNSGTTSAVFTVNLDSGPAAANVTVNYTTADYTAAADSDYVAVSGNLTFTPGQTSKTISVTVKGDKVIEWDEQFHLQLSGAVNAHLLDPIGFGNIMDDEPRFSVTEPSVNEGNSGITPMVFTVTLSTPSDLTVTVDYSTPNFGTATAGSDYDAVSGTLTFLPGQTSKTITVPVRGDTIDESDEDLFVLLSNATNALLLGSLARGNIIDDDTTPFISIGDVTRAEGNSGTTPFQFTISLSTPSTTTVTVNYATAAGSASNSGGNADYQSKSGQLSFAPGQTSQTVTVSVNGDTRAESDETFFVNLSQPVNAVITDGQGIGTILNDETRGKTWIGAANGGSWSTASNWNPSGIPTSDSLVTIAGASVSLNSSAIVSELSLNNGATLSLAPSGSRVFRTAHLYLQSSKLNLNDNDLIVDQGDFAAIRSLVLQGFGPSATSGITSSTSNGSQILALVDNAFVGATHWQGQSIPTNAIVGKYTYLGDVNLDGRVTGDDYTVIDANLNTTAPAGLAWPSGDANLDGFISGDDYTVIDANLGFGSSNPLIPARSAEQEETDGRPADIL